jgi:hypothetical protein
MGIRFRGPSKNPKGSIGRTIEIIGDRHRVFETRSSMYEIAHVRQKVLYDIYEEYKGVAEIIKHVAHLYKFKLSQSAIYYAWYKIRNKMNEKTPSEFIKMKYGSDTVNGKGIYKLMDEYAAYQLSLHVEHPTNIKSDRLDIKNKIKELNER